MYFRSKDGIFQSLQDPFFQHCWWDFPSRRTHCRQTDVSKASSRPARCHPLPGPSPEGASHPLSTATSTPSGPWWLPGFRFLCEYPCWDSHSSSKFVSWCSSSVVSISLLFPHSLFSTRIPVTHRLRPFCDVLHHLFLFFPTPPLSLNLSGSFLLFH